MTYSTKYQARRLRSYLPTGNVTPGAFVCPEGRLWQWDDQQGDFVPMSPRMKAWIDSQALTYRAHCVAQYRKFGYEPRLVDGEVIAYRTLPSGTVVVY